MTVASETNKSGPYNGNGVTTAFDYEFRIVNEDHVRVILTSVAGIETILTKTTHYSVTGVGADNGQIVMVTPPATGEKLTLLRNVPFVQETDLENQGAYNAEDVEDALDLGVMMDQQLQEQIDRAVKLPASADNSELDALVTNILRLGDSADEIDIVANNIADVNTVANNIADVNTVAAISTDVSKVATIDDAVAAVAAIDDQVVDVAVIKADVTTVAGVADDVSTVAGIAAQVTAVGNAADDVSFVAANIADVTNFADVYQGGKPNDPTTRNDGSALLAGDLYFNTSANTMRVFDGAEWRDSSALSLNMVPNSFVGDGVETAFTVGAAAGVAANMLVWVGGVRQKPLTDYTVSGTALTLLAAPANGVEIDTLVIATVSQLNVPADGSVTDASVSTPVTPDLGIQSSKLSFLQSGAGAQYRSVESKLRETVSVKDFGAKGDGITDDTAAFKAARDYLQVNSDFRGGALYIPKGRYRLTDVIAFTFYEAGSVHNIYIEGDGILATTLDFSGAPAGTDGLAFGPGVHFGIKGLMIDGAPRHGVSIDGGTTQFCAMFSLSQLRIQNCGSVGLYVRNGWLETYEDIWSVNNDTGFQFTGFHTSIRAVRCYASGNTNAGFSINSVVYSSFTTCASDENRWGYVLSNLNGVSFIACGTEGNDNDGWLVRTSDALSAGVLTSAQNVRGVGFYNCYNLINGKSAPGSFATFMTLSAENSRPIEITIDGCTSWRNNVADYAVVASGISATISIHERQNSFDGAWFTSGTVRRNSQSGSSIHLSGGSNTIQVGAFSASGATRGTNIDATTFSHSGTGTLTEFVGAFYNANGLVGTIQTAGSSTSYVTTSDEDLKSFLGEMDPAKAIEIILADPVREFTWKADGQHAVGWGAQTSYAVSADLAVPGYGRPGDDDYMPWGVDQSKRTPYLWAAVSWAIGRIEEQSRVIDELRQAISGLEGK